MQKIPIRTTVVGSYPFPGWLEFASQNLDKFGKADIEEMIEDAVIAAVHDQTAAGLDVITDGEQTRLDFNLSFYGYINGMKTTIPKRESLARLRMTSEEKIILLESWLLQMV
jgi:5-methyltetrahydropteroyltriglutamate--homocysteine methyltransferase